MLAEENGQVVVQESAKTLGQKVGGRAVGTASGHFLSMLVALLQLSQVSLAEGFQVRQAKAYGS